MYSNLDPSQREAVCCGSGPCEVIAGPGSGKTLVLTERILYLIGQMHVAPSQILVLTFSRSAAAEMKERFLSRSGEKNKGVLFGTFHSVFFYILKESTRTEYSLLDQGRKDKLLQQLIRNYYPDPDDRPSIEEAEKSLRSESRDFPQREHMEELRRDYHTFLRENGYIDFDDMILMCRRLLTSDEKVLAYWRSRFRFILVDEFQDINAEQYEILKLLTSGEGLFVVGDDDQSIYGFRGSSPAIMERFMTDFAGAGRIFLSSNYRCSGCICKASSRMIAANKMRIAKTVSAARPMGDKTVLKGFPSENDEYEYMLREIKRLTPLQQRETAVIVRTNTHVVKIGNYLSQRGVICSGQANPAQEILQTVIRDLQAYYSLSKGMCAGLLSRQSLYRVMNRPDRFILRSAAQQDYVTPDSLLAMARSRRGSVDAVSEMLRDLRILSSLDPEGFVRYLFDAVGYGEWAASHLGNAEALQSVKNLILRFAGCSGDMEELIRTLLQSSSQNDPKKQSGVRIMTMHVCKGLEFDRVFLPGLNEGIIPVRRCSSPSDFEEERRLLYVAMTRARDHLEMLYVTGTRVNPRPPSRFLSVYGVRNFV